MNSAHPVLCVGLFARKAIHNLLLKCGMLYIHKALLSQQLRLFLDIAFAFSIQFYMAHSDSHVIYRETSQAEGATGNSL